MEPFGVTKIIIPNDPKRKYDHLQVTVIVPHSNSPNVSMFHVVIIHHWVDICRIIVQLAVWYHEGEAPKFSVGL